MEEKDREINKAKEACTGYYEPIASGLRVPRIKAARFATRIPNERVPMFYWPWLFIEQTDENVQLLSRASFPPSEREMHRLQGNGDKLCAIQIVVFQSLVARELKETLNKISPLNCFLRFL